jgi:hypothetical protein
MLPLARLTATRDFDLCALLPQEAVAISCSWSPRKLASASLVLVGAAVPAAIGFVLWGSVAKWLCLAWLLGVALLMHGFGRRAADREAVLSIDWRGILDRRLMPERIEWREIARICTVNEERAHVVDIALRQPDRTLAGTRLAVRIGALCQRGYAVPAITISMLLLDGHVGDLLDVVAQFRPELLHRQNQR